MFALSDCQTVLKRQPAAAHVFGGARTKLASLPLNTAHHAVGPDGKSSSHTFHVASDDSEAAALSSSPPARATVPTPPRRRHEPYLNHVVEACHLMAPALPGTLFPSAASAAAASTPSPAAHDAPWWQHQCSGRDGDVSGCCLASPDRAVVPMDELSFCSSTHNNRVGAVIHTHDDAWYAAGPSGCVAGRGCYEHSFLDAREATCDADDGDDRAPSKRPSPVGRRVLVSPASHHYLADEPRRGRLAAAASTAVGDDAQGMLPVPDTFVAALVAFAVSARWHRVDPMALAVDRLVGHYVVTDGDRGTDIGLVIDVAVQRREAADEACARRRMGCSVRACPADWTRSLPRWRKPFAAPNAPTTPPKVAILRLASVEEATVTLQWQTCKQGLVDQIRLLQGEHVQSNPSETAVAAMDVVGVEVQGDGGKISVYFAAPSEVRIAKFAKTLWGAFRCRVWFQQVNLCGGGGGAPPTPSQHIHTSTNIDSAF